MRSPAFALAGVAGCAGLAFLPAFDRSEVSRTALVLLPWLLWAGWPASAAGPAPGSAEPGPFRSRCLPGLALILPLLALGIELDRCSGHALSDRIRVAGVGLLLCAVWGAARSAAGSARAYFGWWTLVVLLLPAFAAVVSPGDLSAGSPSQGALPWLFEAGRLSPVGWILGEVPHGVGAESTAEGRLPGGVMALVAAHLAWWGAAWGARPAGR